MCAPDQPRPTEALSGRPFSARVRALPSGASQPGGDGAASRGGPESPGPEAGLSLAWRGSIDEPASGLPFPPPPPRGGARAEERRHAEHRGGRSLVPAERAARAPPRRPAPSRPALRRLQGLQGPRDCKGSKGRGTRVPGAAPGQRCHRMRRARAPDRLRASCSARARRPARARGTARCAEQTRV